MIVPDHEDLKSLLALATSVPGLQLKLNFGWSTRTDTVDVKMIFLFKKCFWVRNFCLCGVFGTGDWIRNTPDMVRMTEL